MGNEKYLTQFQRTNADLINFSKADAQFYKQGTPICLR